MLEPKGRYTEDGKFIPTSRGLKFPTTWKGTWGPLNDPRSKISRLARKIETELVEEHKPRTPRQQRLLRRAAKLEALAEQTADTLGFDPKATKRSLTALERAADNKIAQVRASSNGQRERRMSPTPAELLVGLRKDTDDD